jgi:hypothetical protein
MADSAFHIFGRWTVIAFCAVAASLVHAQPPRGPHPGPVGPHAGLAASFARSFARAPNRPMIAGGPGRDARPFGAMANPYRRGGPALMAAPAIPVRPVSDDARTLAREGGAVYLRAGSIRADIARYNEERAPSRVPRPPAADSRPSPSAPLYRN